MAFFTESQQQQKMELEKSGVLASDYTIKLPSSKQCDTGTKMDTQINGKEQRAQK